MNRIIYNLIGFGEEYITKIVYDALKNEVLITIKGIMRSGPNNCEWGFDESMSIEEGILVLTGVERSFLSPNGVIPNDLEEIKIDELDQGLYKITFDACGFDQNTFEKLDATFSIIARDAYLIDTRNPNIKITE